MSLKILKIVVIILNHELETFLRSKVILKEPLLNIFNIQLNINSNLDFKFFKLPNLFYKKFERHWQL